MSTVRRIEWFERDPGGTAMYVAPEARGVRDRDRTSSLDEVPLEDRFPIRNPVLFCDRCETETEADIRADTSEQAYEGLRRLAVAELGWQVTEYEDLCPSCQEQVTLRNING